MIATLTEAVDEDEVLGADLLLLDEELVALESFDHAHESLLLDIFWHDVLHPSVRMGSLAHRVGEEEGEVVLDGLE